MTSLDIEDGSGNKEVKIEQPFRQVAFHGQVWFKDFKLSYILMAGGASTSTGSTQYLSPMQYETAREHILSSWP